MTSTAASASTPAPTYSCPQGTKHEVNGKTLTFYPIRVKLATRLKGISRDVAAAFAALFVDTSLDTGSKSRTTTDNEGFVNSETSAEAISPELAKLRYDLKRKTAQDLIDAFLDEKNVDVFGQAILSSLRDEFPGNSAPPVAEFLEQADLPTFVAMLIGTVKANKGVLGPVGKHLGDLVSMVVESAVAKASGAVEGISLTPKTTDPQETSATPVPPETPG